MLARVFAQRGPLVVTHAMEPRRGAVPRRAGDCVELAELGAWIEITVATCMRGHGPSVAGVLDAIRAIGPARVVLGTDYGWNHELPAPAAGLQDYVDVRRAHGERGRAASHGLRQPRAVGLDPA